MSTTAGERPTNTVDAVLRRHFNHPHAIPIVPGNQQFWLIQVGDAPPLGYVRRTQHRGSSSLFVFDCYAHCRDENGGRPWLFTAEKFGSAVAWMLQHEREITRVIARSEPEPEPWPPGIE